MKIAKPIPSYLLHKGTGQARVQIAGRDIYLGPYGSKESKEKYSRLVAEMEAAGNIKMFEGQGRTVAEIVAEYLVYAENYYRKDGHRTAQVDHIKLAVKPLLVLYASLPAQQFGPLALQAVIAKMIEMDLCRRTINNLLGDLKRVFKWATRNELFPGEKFHALSTVGGLKAGRSAARETPPVKPVGWQGMRAVIRNVSPQVASMIKLQYLTGMRSGELVRMRGINIIIRKLTGDERIWLYLPESHKTQHHGHSRTIPLGPRARAILEKFIQPDGELFLFRPAEAELFRNETRHKARKTKQWPSHSLSARRRRRRANGIVRRKFAECYTPGAYRKAIERGCEKAGVKNWHPHQLRHSFGTMIREKFGVEVSQVMLGHATMQATEIYAEASLTKAIEVARAIG